MDFLAVLDVGTTQIKGFSFDFQGNILDVIKVKTPLKTPKPGFVEQDAEKIWEVTLSILEEILAKYGKPKALGITTQRASTIVWDRETGEPLHPIITWQDTRAARLAEAYSNRLQLKTIRLVGKIVSGVNKRPKKLPLVYLATLANFRFGPNQPIMQLKWLLMNIDGLQNKAEERKVLFGTIDTWIIYKLTGGLHITDYTNASATGLFDPFYLKWSDRLSRMVGIPKGILPRVVDSMGKISTTKNPPGIHLTAIIADQQASLFSIAGTSKGIAKITLGTGGFMDLSLGPKPMASRLGTYPLIYIKYKEHVQYMLEGIIQSVGSVVDVLLRLGIIEHYEELYELPIDNACKLIFIPALAGIGTPYWDPNLKGLVYGLDRSTTKDDLSLAALEGIAYRFKEVKEALESVSGMHIGKVYVDGNVARIEALLQLMADFADVEVLRVDPLENTARGAFLLARGGIRGLDLPEAYEFPKISAIYNKKHDFESCVDAYRKHLRRCVSA